MAHLSLKHLHAAACLLTLVGGTASVDALEKVLRRSKYLAEESFSNREEVAGVFADLYGVDGRIEALQPDLLGERLVARVLRKDAALRIRLNALGRREEALLATQEAVEILLPFFQRYPAALAQNMGVMSRNYLRYAEEAGRLPDEGLIGEINAVFEALRGDG